MEEQFEDNFLEIKNFSEEDVFSFNSGMCKASEIVDKLKTVLVHELAPEMAGRTNKKMGFSVVPKFNSFTQGIDCEVLKVNSRGWQKGKIRFKVTLEFCLDETDYDASELIFDDLSQIVSIDNHNK